jgi:WD40 repeat protein
LLFICDAGNNCIRQLDLTTNIVTTFAGSKHGTPGLVNGRTNESLFKTPTSSCLSPNGKSLFVCDKDNLCLRKIDILSGIVSTFVNLPDTNDNMTNRPERCTFSPCGTFMLLCTYMTNFIRSIDMKTKQVTRFVGSETKNGFINGDMKNAIFRNITDCLFSSDGTLYVCDSMNKSIRIIDLTTREVKPFIGMYKYNIGNFPGEYERERRLSKIYPLTFTIGNGFLYFCDTKSNFIGEKQIKV